jgi:RNA polymerase sigma-70 factor (ECF subfamily)
MNQLKADSAETAALLERIDRGERRAVDELLDRHRAEMCSFVEARLDPRVGARLDPSDVVQEAHLTVARRMHDYLKRRPMSFKLWLRKTAYERLLDIQRHHLRRARRSVGREVALPRRSSLLLARPLLARGASPEQEMARREFNDRVAQAVSELPASDGEILLMRHGEEMAFDEIAAILGIEAAAARKRFGRALIRLQKLLTEHGLLE